MLVYKHCIYSTDGWGYIFIAIMSDRAIVQEKLVKLVTLQKFIYKFGFKLIYSLYRHLSNQYILLVATGFPISRNLV